MNIRDIYETEIRPLFRTSTELSFHKHLVREILLRLEPEDVTDILKIVISTLRDEENVSLRIMNAFVDVLMNIESESRILYERIETIYLTSVEKNFDEVKFLFVSPPPVMVADPKDYEEWDVELSKVTLGERKSFAKRLDRKMVERLLRDPTPEVIRILLLNPRLFESDVIALGARRPNFAPVLLEIYNSFRWKNNRRIRVTLVRNPYSYPKLSIKLAYMLPKTELCQVRNDTEIHPVIRDVAKYLTS
ncbi:MAG: hypothetical protein N2746_02955 [Deltaproteobacteria bacterium]|nr:hypothetical protein [Deltaproteobacteria bacterium]